ncbi:biliverdin-producing heme oxygenase [Actinokineospora xionganensis]|uniref:Biliverdin-producing heme oxygenase n=1 Tax=Actinokineospora xionganensis TaxID=2684470 RepID=A0ABR7LGA6_9PSEU|nr:biliverdin-producing heme oxygenase [Actinokineospora xionganensis]MBC6451667.1 biliverdin-producing heme oxygenase [Actinokineospora xionganensis]
MSEEIPFSQELRLATREGHDRAQESAYIVALLAGDLSQAGYTALAVQHYFIYDALESAATAMREDLVAGPFVIDALRRMPGLVDDLEALVGPDWRAKIRPASATAEYVDRVAAVSGQSARFVAHQYTRYLGDIAGGQVIRNRLRAQHGIRARFYDFDALGPAPVFRDKYRALLDSAPWSPAERADLISEAQVAFELNTAVFEELAEDMHRYLVA